MKDFFNPKFDETGHLNYLDNPGPDFMDLLNMLQECVNFLTDLEVEDHHKETYGNLLMNAENMLLMANQAYGDNHSIGDEIIENNS